MTEQEVMDALGLEPWADFAEKQKQANFEHYLNNFNNDRVPATVLYRRTGRTTKILVAALLWLSNNQGTVHVKGWNDSYTYQITCTLRRYAETLGIDPLRVKRMADADIMWHDHYLPYP